MLSTRSAVGQDSSNLHPASPPRQTLGALLVAVVVLLVTGPLIGAVASGLVMAVAEVSAQVAARSYAGFLELAVGVVAALLHILAGVLVASFDGARTGLYVGAACALVYVGGAPILRRFLTPQVRQTTTSLLLALAGTAGAVLGVPAGGELPLVWTVLGGVLFGLVAGLILARPAPGEVPGAARRGLLAWALAGVVVLAATAAVWTTLAPRPGLQLGQAGGIVKMPETVISAETAPDLVQLGWLELDAPRRTLFSPDSRTLFVATAQGVARVDAHDLAQVTHLDTGPADVLSLSPDGALVATAAGTTVQLWNGTDGSLVHTLPAQANTVLDLAFSPDGALLGTAGEDRTVQLWRVEDGTLAQTLRHLGAVQTLDFRPDGDLLITGSNLGITAWQPATGVRLHVLGIGFATVRGVRFSRDGTLLAAALDGGGVQLWQADEFTFLRDFEGHEGMVAGVAFSPDGRLLATGGADAELRLWRVEDGAALAALAGHEASLTAITFSPDGRLLATTAADGTVRLWGTPTGQ